MATYHWTVYGNATISGANNMQNVKIQAGTICNAPFTLRLDITDVHSCSNSCEITVNVNDITPPVITFCPGNQSVIVNSGNVYIHSGTGWNATASAWATAG